MVHVFKYPGVHRVRTFYKNENVIIVVHKSHIEHVNAHYHLRFDYLYYPGW